MKKSSRSVPKETSELDRMMDEALARKGRNDYEGALEVLVRLTRKYKDYAPAFGLAAGLYWQTKQLDKAIKYGRKATLLSPKSELASFVLFQSLLDKDDWKSAMKELQRFVLLRRKSEMYRSFLEELAEAQKDESKREFLGKLAKRVG